jgi:calcium-dependent protein kinase
MHNLSGVYLKEESSEVFEGITFYCFSVVYPKKIRYYYVDNLDEYHKWVGVIKIVTGYADLNDIFEVKEKLGNGKFGLVRLGIHKETGRKVAIKIITKKDMDNKDLELIKTEIDILKICQHPNIIKLYDIFENPDYIYISSFHLI